MSGERGRFWVEPDPYDALDECVKQYFTRNEYLWLPDGEKHTIVEDLTQPDWSEP